MASYNRIILAGNLTRDPQLKYLPSQTAIVEFGLAINRKYKAGNETREEVCFIDCAAFGNLAEVVNQYCNKGGSVLIEGRLKFDSWEDKNGGGRRSKHSVAVENLVFLGGKGGEHQRDQRQRAQSSVGGSAARQWATQPVDNPIGDNQEFSDNDIPF